MAVHAIILLMFRHVCACRATLAPCLRRLIVDGRVLFRIARVRRCRRSALHSTRRPEKRRTTRTRRQPLTFPNGAETQAGVAGRCVTGRALALCIRIGKVSASLSRSSSADYKAGRKI